jgi:sortase A
MIHYPYHYCYTKRLGSPIKVKPKSKLTKLLPTTLITLGSIMIANVLWPLLDYQLFSSPALRESAFISPVPKELLGRNVDLTNRIPQVMGESIDYTDPVTWFPKAVYNPGDLKPTSYSLDIPSVQIKDAVVYVGGHNLEQGLIQYPGTSDPGDFGTTVVFGHSVLRQFYNPSKDNPRRYLSIFSKIMTLKNGDRIYLNYDGHRLTYEVKNKLEVNPEDLDVLTQQLTVKELKLITCVPEGTYLRRGVVVAQLVNEEAPNTTNVIQETGL